MGPMNWSGHSQGKRVPSDPLDQHPGKPGLGVERDQGVTRSKTSGWAGPVGRAREPSVLCVVGEDFIWE